MVYLLYSTFTKRDVSILSNYYNESLYHFNTEKKYYLIFAFFKQFLFFLFNFYKYKITIIQSSGYLSFLPVIFGKILNKPIIIIAIGTDCAKLPEINYGAHSKALLSWFTCFSFKKASLILPVHKSLENSLYSYKSVKYPNQGIRSLCKNVNTEIIEIVNGYDTQKWKLINNIREKKSFLTVTFAVNEIGYYRKGIDLILKTAKLFPNYHFTIVGKVYLKEECPENIQLIGNVNQIELVKIYNNHKYYLQLSMFEGFPNALCEAMLCGCIPIGSNVAGIPDIIGDKGYILEKKDETLLKNIILTLDTNDIQPSQVREQIVTNFPIERREKNLKHQITKILRKYK